MPSRGSCLTAPSDFEGGLQDFGKQAHQLLSAVCALDEKFGTRMPILLLRGSVSDGATPRVCSEGRGCGSVPLHCSVNPHVDVLSCQCVYSIFLGEVDVCVER